MRSARLPRLPLLDFVTLVLAGAIFLGLTLYQLDLPGLYYDEAWDAVATMHIVQGTPVELERGASITLFGRAWPLMLDDYQGIISTYLLVPFFLIGGINVTSLRAFPIVSGLIALILCYFLARAWFGRGAARLAVLLFALSPSWIFWSRIGVYVVAEVVPLTLGALIALTAWWRAPRGRDGLLYLASGLLGLGLATKLLYIWPIVAILACYILLHGRALWRVGRDDVVVSRQSSVVSDEPVVSRQSSVVSDEPVVSRQSSVGSDDAEASNSPDAPGHWSPVTGHRSLVQQSKIQNPKSKIRITGAVVCFSLGAFTFLAYNWQTLGTWQEIRSSAVQTDAGTNNTTVLPNLWEETDRYRVLLDGGYFWFQGVLGQVHIDPLAPLAFVLAALGLLAAAIGALPCGWPTTLPRGRLLLATILAYVPALGLLGAAYLQPNSRTLWLMAPAWLAVAAATVAGGALIRGALRQPAAWARLAGGALLLATTGSAVTWLQTGQPDGLARGPLDLRLTDMTGVLFWISLAELLVLLGWSAPATRWQRPLVATVGYLAAVLGQSFPTLSGLWPTHLLVMLPLPQILVGAALAGLGGQGLGGETSADRREATPTPGGAPRAWGWRPVAAGAVTLALLASALWTDIQYHRDLTRTGGLFAFSDGIYNLHRYLAKDPSRPIVVAEWGIRRQLQILSNGALDPAEIFQYGGDAATLAAFDQALEAALKRDRRTRYVFTADDIGPYKRFPEFQRVLAAHGLAPFLEHTSY
ncbi:MAG TPA: glycosyltransferase family 39 protein, partial [Chloroflexia bacterium]|nr:glycosyltransferase family 39 protein [Chloroflexia bacterium]